MDRRLDSPSCEELGRNCQPMSAECAGCRRVVRWAGALPPHTNDAIPQVDGMLLHGSTLWVSSHDDDNCSAKRASQSDRPDKLMNVSGALPSRQGPRLGIKKKSDPLGYKLPRWCSDSILIL